MSPAEHLLRASAPYDGPRLLSFLGVHAVPGVEYWNGATYTRSLQTPAGPAVVGLTAAPDGITVSGDVSAAVLRRLEHLLATTSTTTAAERALARDALLGPLVGARPGLRPPGSIDDGEILVRTVVGQQVSLAGARAVLGRMCADLGEPLPAQLSRPGVTRLFPTMAALAACDPLQLPMPRSRARAVVACAGAVAQDGALPEREQLLALPGVGPWTTDYVDLRCRRDPDVFLPTDLAVRRVLEQSGLAATPRAATALAAGWAPYRSTALIHLWTAYLEPEMEPPTEPAIPL